MSVHSANERTYDRVGRWRTETYANSATAGGVNETLYIVGDEFTDGSIRLNFTGADDVVSNMETRKDGVWNDTGFRFSSASVSIGRDLIISAVSGFIETQNPSQIVKHRRSLIPHIKFDEQGTDDFGDMPVLDVLKDFPVFGGTPVGEKSGTTIDQVFTDAPSRVLTSSTHTIGSVGATSEIQVSYYKGNDNSGVLFNRFILPASDMATPNDPLVLNFKDDFGFDGEVEIFQEFKSDNPISLKTNAANQILTTHTGHELKEVDILLDELVISNDLSLVFDDNLGLIANNRFP